MRKEYKDLYITTGEAAKLLNVCRASIINYCENGRLKSAKHCVNNYRKISLEEIIRFGKSHNIDLVNKLDFVKPKTISHIHWRGNEKRTRG